ncbi:pilus assembly protein TadG-related protein [Pseudonocardia sp. DLS-67]
MTADRGGGSVSTPMAISVLAMMLVVGFAIDGVRAAQGVARADALAEEAARAAGQELDPAGLAQGVIRVDPGPAAESARRYLDAAGVEGDVVIIAPDRIQVEVTVRRSAVLLGLVGRDEFTSRGSAEAILVPVLPEGGSP